MATNSSSPVSFVSFPEVEVKEIEFGITLRSYKIRLRLASAATDHVSFTPAFSNSVGSIISCVRRSVDMPCFLPPHYFTFYAQMEKESPIIDDSQNASSQEEVCVLYLALKELPENEFLLTKYAVNVVCGCGQDNWNENALLSNENFLDFGSQPMTTISRSSPLVLSRHQHDYTTYGLQQEYFVSACVFDFSKATVVPFEAQRIVAKKRCGLQLINHVVNEWNKPFDLSINCKGGYTLGAHKNILSVRSRVFKAMLDSHFQEDETSTIHVLDLTAPVMKIILHFIYTGELDPGWMDVSVEDIVYGADKYELLELLGFFDHLMIMRCDTHNALRLAQLAERHSLTNAKNCILGFIEMCKFRQCVL